MAATSTDQELSRWSKQLADHRQPWPEWEKLEQFVERERFALEADQDVPFPNQFLSGPRDERAYRIIHNVLTESQEGQFCAATAGNSIFPQYLVALLDLKYSDSLFVDDVGLD